jgi:pyruvate, orthophosphate dikinase
MEKETGKKFGDPKNPAAGLGPLRLARLDARHDGHDSQPGPQRRDRRGLKARPNNGRFAWDSYRRFVQMYGDVVMGVQKRHENEHEPFDEVMDD